MAALTPSTIKQLPRLEGAENVRAPDGRWCSHHQFAVRVTLQNTALKIEAARRLFQARWRRTRRRGAWKRAVLAREFRQQGLHQLTEGDGGGHRVTRQAAEPAAAELAEGEGFPRLNRQLPGRSPQLFEDSFGVIGFTPPRRRRS